MPRARKVHNRFSNFLKSDYTRYRTVKMPEEYVRVYLCVLLMPVVVCHV